MRKNAAPIRFAGCELHEMRHICAFFNSDDEAYRVAGIDVTGAERTGQLEVRASSDTYLRDGFFDTDRMLEAFEHLASGNGRSGFPLSRIVCCVYDLAKFRGDTVIDIIRTHLMTIIGGMLQHNPFFVPPDAFLQELRQRRHPAAGTAAL